jgi:hypothetical protein
MKREQSIFLFNVPLMSRSPSALSSNELSQYSVGLGSRDHLSGRLKLTLSMFPY